MNRKNVIGILIMLALGIGIFAWELHSTNVNQLTSQIQSLNWGWLIVAFASMLLSYFFESLVLRELLSNRGDRKYGKWELFRIPLIQALFNAITPFSSGGQPAQLVGLMQSGVEAGRASSVLLMKFIIYQTMVLINFIFALLFSFENVAKHYSGLSVLIIGGFIVHLVTISLLLMIMYKYSFTRKLAIAICKPIKKFMSEEKGEEFEKKVLIKIDTFYEESLILKKEKKKVARAAVLTFIQLLFYYLVVYFVLLACNAKNVDVVQVIVLHIMIVMIVSIFPVPGGTGGAEYSFKSLFSKYLTSSSQMVLGMFLWRFITFYLGIFLGIIAVAKKPKIDNFKSESSGEDK